MRDLRKIAREMKEKMIWAKELSPDMPVEILIAKVLTLLLESGMKINRQNVSQLIDEFVPLKKDYYALVVVDENGYWEAKALSDEKQVIDDLYAQKVGEVLIETGTIIEEKEDDHITFENGMEVWKISGKGEICDADNVYLVYGDTGKFKIDSVFCRKSDAEERIEEIVEEYESKGHDVIFKDNVGCSFDNHDAYKISYMQLLHIDKS